MTDDAEKIQSESADETSSSKAEDRGLLRLETRLAQAEAQIYALQDTLGDIQRGGRVAKQRALMIRLVILASLLGWLFYMLAARSGAS